MLKLTYFHKTIIENIMPNYTLALHRLVVWGIGWKLVLSLDSGIKARQTPGLFVGPGSAGGQRVGLAIERSWVRIRDWTV